MRFRYLRVHMRYNKYRVSDKSRRTLDGTVFASLKEMGRYQELRLLEKGKQIKSLTLQPKFLLQPAFVDRTKTSHRAIYYVADFAYFELDKLGNFTHKVIEDVKGYKTDVYLLKKKLLLYQYQDIDFREV